jgi:hypothetical protein
MKVTIEMDNGLCAQILIDEGLLDQAYNPTEIAWNQISKRVGECVMRRNEEPPRPGGTEDLTE